jgi:hypothetical protein
MNRTKTNLNTKLQNDITCKISNHFQTFKAQCDQGEKTYKMYIMIFEKVEVENSPIFEAERGIVLLWSFSLKQMHYCPSNDGW